MTDEQRTAPEPETREITFRDRAILVKMPTAEQLLVWRRTLTQVERLNAEPPKDGYDYMKVIDRTRRIIDSVLVNENDKEWLDDLFLDEGLTLNEAGQVVIMTIEKFGEGSNRAEKRAAAPKKRARLKVTPGQ